MRAQIADALIDAETGIAVESPPAIPFAPFRTRRRSARRMLPMVPGIYAALKARWEAAGKTEAGWIFPAVSQEGHLDKDTAKVQHKKAIDRANAKAMADGANAIPFFQPHVLRHTALTQLANTGCDVFTLARIAGHSSIAIAQRYVHPQADAIERAFQQVQQSALPEPSSAKG
jgi:integrase